MVSIRAYYLIGLVPALRLNRHMTDTITTAMSRTPYLKFAELSKEAMS